ncbi:glycosyltransferase family 4 protein [Parapusillimonas granuli]|uniref:Glycosyltransferase family 4 protein n=1 Tax=Parapusillimonas granuli TaxID=380911 RepID=A0A853G4A9_9BURK|nr:glycosyltransferase family 4 protein [Parapusillimonas granuli]MBB5215244.1 glycosyltransferase involved in cell wall biosynthesis [Parapusillimonas granuli]MEB2398421.1 glycosyltransferase family 4 protein [Alcaligenaceae bacterium]NYT49561.1 glycosyltransferase family 4 protein [Parapusillimonas granuli]
MKILFFVSSMHAGGAERVAATLSSAWARRGDSVTLVPTYTRKGTCFYHLNPAVRLVWLADRMSWLGRRLLPSVSKWFAVRRLIREVEPDVIVSFLTNVNVVVLSATRGMKIPVIVCERTNPAFSSSASDTLKRLRRSLYPRATTVVLQSRDSVDAFRAMVPGLKDIAVVPNPLPPGIDEVGQAEVVSWPRRYRLLGMGRLVPSKRFDALIQAFSALAEAYPDWDLVIWGEGPERKNLEQLVQASGLASRVSLPGRTEQPWEEVVKADVFAMTSEVEGFPNVLLEAMALGRACVSVDCPSGPREISEGGKYALLAPLGDQPALCNALEQLMSDPTLRDVMGRRAAASVRERYGLPGILAQWDGVFARAMQPADTERPA